MKVYVAGWDVYLPNAAELAEKKRDILQSHGFLSLHPLEIWRAAQGLAPGVAEKKIFSATIALLESADAVISDITPHRGVSADPSTAFVMGFLAAAKKPIFAYSNVTLTYLERVAELAGPVSTDAHGRFVDGQGMVIRDDDLIEDFRLEKAWRDIGAKVVLTPTAAEERYNSLVGFGLQVTNMARELLHREYLFADPPERRDLPTSVQAGRIAR